MSEVTNTSTLREALAELVALKDGPRDAEYERRKPLAWQAAREALTAALEHEWEYRAINPNDRADRVAHGTEREIRSLVGMFPALHIERRIPASPWERMEVEVRDP